MRPELLGEVALRAPVPPSEVSAVFLQGMINRMAVSYFKYGPVASAYPEHVNALKSAIDRIEKYVATKNTEFLVDAANFMMIEFMHPSDPDAFFEGTDSDQSPGRVLSSGERSEAANSAVAVS